ncbi:MAG: hypothetical protein EHM93_17600 [Bacteroidales bacterium]|nr:MAG: hypothetical protein EHM93_17600 [Bacteroidales bacterium]
MKIKIIKDMINNSTWVDPENKTIYKFAENNELFINGKNHLRYLLKMSNNQIVIKLGSKQAYFVEYVSDFNLKIYNDEEVFRITPA